jgi:predicted metal-dependent hydrolase
MSRKRERIRSLMEQWREKHHDVHHLVAFVGCFNQQLFYEAHEVLEELWLPNRQGFDGPFYKGLIQLAGAFVHVQKKRLGPAAALLSLAQSNLKNYPSSHHGFDVLHTKALIEECELEIKEVRLNINGGWQRQWPTLRLSRIGPEGQVPKKA